MGPKDHDTDVKKGDVSETGQPSLEVKLLHGVVETPTSVSYKGARLPKGNSGEVPPPRSEHYIDDEFTLDLQQKIAFAWKNHQPIMIEGGSSLGKSSTVRKMAAELGWSLHSINLQGAADTYTLMGQPTTNMEKRSDADPDFVFADGPVTAAIREAASGKKVVLLIDEINVARPDVLIRLHEIIDRYEDGGEVVITENNGERIKMIKENLHIICAANPPSRGNSEYADRNPLDIAQFRRWAYVRLPDELPPESFESFVKSLFSALGEEPWVRQLCDQFMGFHREVVAMVKNREVGGDQPQPISFDSREEPIRVVQFMQEMLHSDLYEGDPSLALRGALEFYYANKILEESEREMVMQKIAQIATESGKRIGLDIEGAIEPDQVGHYVANKVNELIEEEGLNPKDVLPLLAGISGKDVPLAEHIREEQFTGGNYKAVGKALAGLEEEMTTAELNMVIKLKENGRLAAAYYSVIGFSAKMKGWESRLEGPLKDAEDIRARLICLAGCDTPEAWIIRGKTSELLSAPSLKDSAVGKSLIACESDLAWELRDKLHQMSLSGDKKAVTNLAYSLVGMKIGEPSAKLLRDWFIFSENYDELMISILGDDSDEAWEMRQKFLPLASPEVQARAISGLFSENAQRVRAQIDDKNMLALSLNSEWEVAALKSLGIIFNE